MGKNITLLGLPDQCDLRIVVVDLCNSDMMVIKGQQYEYYYLFIMVRSFALLFLNHTKDRMHHLR